MLSYVVSMVEENALEEDLDVDGLCEMVSACLPEFSTIEKEAVSKWLLDVESKLKQESKENENCQSHSDPLNQISLTALLPAGAQRMRVHHLSETSDAGSDSSGEYFSEVRDGRCTSSVLSERFYNSAFFRVGFLGILLASGSSAARDVPGGEPCRS